MKERILQYWNGLSPERRQSSLKVVGVVALGIVGTMAYYATDRDEKRSAPPPPAERKITLGTDMLEDDIRAEVRQRTDEIQAQITARDSDVADIKEALSTLTDEYKRQRAAEKGKLNEPSGPSPMAAPQNAMAGLTTNRYPPRPGSTPQVGSTTNMQLPTNQVNVAMEPKFVGSIKRVEAASGAVGAEGDGKKKRTVHLSPGFMEAQLLSGVRANASKDAKNEPMVLIMRIQAPAVLPNDVRADVEGCLAFGNATGSLNTERVDVRMVSIACMSKHGRFFIEEKIKGFVVDADGIHGLSGIPVTKQGAIAGRAFLSGFVGGVGDAMSISSTTTSVSPLGATQTIDGDRALQGGIGGGIKTTGQEFQKFYVDLLRQLTPAIEVGTAKKLTVVLQEGVELEIKERENHEDESNS